jgi:hypothetical protein
MTENNQIYPPDDASQQAFFTQASHSQYNDQNDEFSTLAPRDWKNLTIHNFSQPGLIPRSPSPRAICHPASFNSPPPALVQPEVKPAAKPSAKRARDSDPPAPSKATPPRYNTDEYIGLANALIELKPYGALHGKKGEAWDGIAAYVKGKGLFLTSSPETIKNKASALLKYQEVRTCFLVSLLTYY